MEKLNISKILPDPDQPRKYFNAEKMKTLQESIKKYGIRQPIIVEEMGNGKYLLEDGERRYRAAVALGLKEVPVIIEKARSKTDRLVQQFNIQEQHEAWTPTEKAVAIANLSDELGLSLQQTCKVLNVTEGDQRRYTAFAQLVDKDGWIRSEVPLDFAPPLVALKSATKHVMEVTLEKEWTRNDDKKLENRVTTLIKSGGILKRGDLTRIKDAFVKEPKMIQKFLTDAKTTPASIFMESKAQGARHLRNAIYAANYLDSHGSAFLKIRDVKLEPQHLQTFKRAIEVAKQLVALGE